MVIEKKRGYLLVWSNIYFDDKECFCGRPYIMLLAHKEKNIYGWDANTIGIAIHDNNDFDVGLIYKTDSEYFETVLHELINWMRDHEQGRSIYANIWKPFEFFPDCGCERERW